MKYTSTRSKSIICTFEEALCSGYAPDGGLFVPEHLPRELFCAERLRGQFDGVNWYNLNYVDLTFEVLKHFIDKTEIPPDDLRKICRQALQGFSDPKQVVPVKPLQPNGSTVKNSKPFFVAELFHGPTFCFKDLGMSMVIRLLSYFCSKRSHTITLLVATTGDTGPAAVQAVCDANNPLLNILVHYPEGQISSFQRRQLTTVKSERVRVVAFEGDGDDMDRPIKNLLASSRHEINTCTKDEEAINPTTSSGSSIWTGVNSYNIGRPLMQMVHFVWTYLRVTESMLPLADKSKPANGEQENTLLVDFVLPTGAMGNIAGGYMAKQMGLPIGTLIAGVNENDITDRVFQTGQFHKSDKMHKTLSDAINIQIPYNFERLLYYLTDENHELVSNWMKQVDERHQNDLSEEWLQRLQEDFDSAVVTDAEMCTMIRALRDKYNYWIDPHTAIAFGAAQKLGFSVFADENGPDSLTIPTRKDRLPTKSCATALLATASPCKFEESLTAAVGQKGWDEFRDSSGGFPKAAERILELREKDPVKYVRLLGGQSTLLESQRKWEESARLLIQELEKCTGSCPA